ncbi:MAG TPA: hypothetical protein VF395_08315 [Polyangiaceae bacterium]
MADARSKRAVLAGLAAIAVVACVAYSPVLAYGFVYDDHWTVENNAALSSGLGPLLRTLATGRAALRGIPDATRPSMVVSVWVDRRLFGSDPAGYHLHSLLLYAIVSAVSGLAVFSLTRRRTAGVLGGLLFAVMPVHAEVVAGVNYREDLYAALGVFSVVAWLFWPRRKKELVDHSVLVAAILFVGLFAKESAIVALPLVLVLAWIRTSTAASARAWARSRHGSLAAFMVALAVFSTWRAWLRLANRDDVPLVLKHRGLLERLLRTARYVTRAAMDGLLPFRWSPDHAPEPSPSPWWCVPLFLLFVVAALLARRRRARPFAAGLSFLLLAPIATSPLVSPINETADRYVFMATLGGAIIWGTLADRARLGDLRPFVRGAVLLSVLLPLAWFSRRAAAPWQTDLALWQAATDRAPDSPRAWAGLSRTLRVGGDLDGADRAVARAVELDPRFLRARVVRLYNRLSRGDVEGARREFGEIQRLGGSRQQGMRQAAKCLELPPAEAPRCAGFPSN